MRIQAMFFDIDGTLVDSNDFHVSAWQEAFEAHGHPVAKPRIREQIGKGADMLLPALLPGLDPKAREAISQTQQQHFRARYLERVQPFAHATELLQTLHTRGMKVLLASSSHRAEVDHYVQLLKARAFLTGYLSGDDVRASKPAGEIFAQALKTTGSLPASEVMAVGDTPYDALSAAKCGIRTIGVRTGGFSDQQLREAGAVALYDSVAALLAGLNDSPLYREPQSS